MKKIYTNTGGFFEKLDESVKILESLRITPKKEEKEFECEFCEDEGYYEERGHSGEPDDIVRTECNCKKEREEEEEANREQE